MHASALIACVTPLARACCKAEAIAKLKLDKTALATNHTGLTVDQARREHVRSAMRFVPSTLLEDANALRLEFGFSWLRGQTLQRRASAAP